ncbi:MAG: zinc ribbon domain-containing protein [Clostridiales bacterium]|nr:zinc ribbon domain-containing protein [Clostridiales bacterium]
MQKCTNCNRPIPDGAKFCGHCGKTTGFEPNQPQQPPFVQYQVQSYTQSAQPSATDADVKPKVKPNCDLSVAGFVMALFSPYLCVIAFILSAAALTKKQVRRRLALAGLIISLIEIALVVAVYVAVYVLHVDVMQYLPFLQKQ